jgi:hypothetical protein
MAQTIFRPYGTDGSDSVRCTNKSCQLLNPPEAKYCWNCGLKLPPRGFPVVAIALIVAFARVAAWGYGEI